MSKFTRYRYQLPNNKAIDSNNKFNIHKYINANLEKVIQIPLSSTSLKYDIHINEKLNFQDRVNKCKANNKTVNNVIILERNNDCYTLVLGFKPYTIAKGLNQEFINAIVIDGTRDEFISENNIQEFYKVKKLTNLKVLGLFDACTVHPEKLEQIKEYYYKHHALDQPITITKDGVIIDGYARYIFARNFELEFVECVIV